MSEDVGPGSITVEEVDRVVDDIPEPAHRLLRGPWTRTRPTFVTGILRQHTGHNAREEVGIWDLGDLGVLSPRADGTAIALLATSIIFSYNIINIYNYYHYYYYYY